MQNEELNLAVTHLTNAEQEDDPDTKRRYQMQAFGYALVGIAKELAQLTETIEAKVIG